MIDYSDPITRSNKCKTQCIDLGNNFCLSAGKEGGECIEKSTLEFVAADIKNNSIMCSEDNPKAPKWFKYLTCPNEPACGSQDIYPSYDNQDIESQYIREIDQYTNNFVLNDVCSYIIHPPAEMKTEDSLMLRVNSMENVVVFVHKQP